MEIPSKYEAIIREIVKQLEEFEQAYGYIPKVKLTTQANYESLVKALQQYQQQLKP